MKYLIFLLIPFIGISQDCSICPPGDVTLDGSSFNSGAIFSWTCTNGFNSNLQNPVFSPSSSTTCHLIVTDGTCVSQQTLEIEVCDCINNDPCVSMAYNPSTDCVTFTNIGSSSSVINTSQIQWKNQFTSFANISSGSNICGCDIKEYLNTSAVCSIDAGTKFRLEITGLSNRCPGCAGSDMSIFWHFPNPTYSATSTLFCAQNNDWYSVFDLTPANLVAAGSRMDAYVMYNTDFGVVVNQYRFTYNGAGLNCSNITIQEIRKGTIYKDITAKRLVTYADGCPDVECEILLDIPQQPNNPCFSFTGYMNSVNLGSPCSGSALSVIAINGQLPLSYQWSYNGSDIPGNVSGSPQRYCLVGAPTGVYCCEVTDNAGCVFEICSIVQPPCNLNVSISSSGNILTANLTNCTGGSPSYQWSRWNGSIWVNVGTSSTYNTGGLAGQYRVSVTCGTCTNIGLITFTPPCTIDVNITSGTTTLTANVTGCSGATINYLWETLVSGSWTFVQTINTTSTSNILTPLVSGIYRITAICNGCTDQAQTSFTILDPCSGFSTNITGTFSNLCLGNNYTYNRTNIGGSSPYTTTWKINGTTVSTSASFTYTASALGSFNLSVTVVDNLGCSSTDVESINIITCCNASVSLSSDASVCQNESATFTATPSGGSSPYVYNWTSQLSPNPPVSQGSGNSKVLSFNDVGLYNIVVQVTDNNGCIATDNATMNVTTCSSCVCTPDLTLTGCVLNANFSGAGCGAFSYQLQYSATGTGWTTILSGLVSSGNFNHTPTANGIYRLAIFASACGAIVDDVSINCYNPTCSNDPTLNMSGTYQEVCGLNPVTITGNTFGGSATSVTLTENGTGTLSTSVFGLSPFSFTYNPLTGDYNNTVTINGITNNPLGSPCVPAIGSYGIFIKPIPTPSITSSNGNICINQTRSLTANPSGGTFTIVSGPATLVGNTLTATGAGNIVLNYSLTVQGCTGATTQTIVSESCPCDGLSMNVTILTGGISFGTLNFNGVAQTNYQIQWRKCSDHSIAFTSGMGTGAGTGIYPHPSSNVPLVGDCYYAFIVFSPQGSNLDCFSDFTVANWTCLNPPSYTYNGPGGASATREFRMDIATSTNIKIANFQTQTVPDLLEVIYNGVTLYSSNNQTSLTQTPFVIPITYISGQNYVTFRVTNSNPTSNTIWTISNVSCCPTIVCPTMADVPQITSLSAVLNNQCGCTFTPTFSLYTLNCSGCSNPSALQTSSVGNCVWQQSSNNGTCYNENVVITKLSGASKSFDFSSSTNYNLIKTAIQSISGGDQRLLLQFHVSTCGNDGVLIEYKLLPAHHTIVYDDVNFVITITIPVANPFTNDCNNCSYLKFTDYNSIYNNFNSTNSVGNYQSIRLIRSEMANKKAVLPSTFTTIIRCLNGSCGADLDRRYRRSYRDSNCPCQSWQLHEDTDDNGTYETLVLEAAGWTGVCL